MSDDYAPWRALRALDERWITLLQEEFNASLQRSSDAYVSWLADTRTLIVSPDHELDPDDTIAQIVLHELCHHLVEGLASDQSDDWGLDNMSDEHLANEYAALRLQAAITDAHGLRPWLNPTTDHRWFHASLQADPLQDAVHPPSDQASVRLAQRGWESWGRWRLKTRVQAELDAAASLLSSL